MTYGCPRCAELERQVESAQHAASALRAQLDAVRRYADGLHFAGRLKDEKVVRAALGERPERP